MLDDVYVWEYVNVIIDSFCESLRCKLLNNVTFKYSFFSVSATDFFREQLYVLNFVCNFRLQCIPLLFRTHHCVEYGSNKMMSSYCQKQTWTLNLWGQWAMFENTDFCLILLLCCMKFISHCSWHDVFVNVCLNW